MASSGPRPSDGNVKSVDAVFAVRLKLKSSAIMSMHHFTNSIARLRCGLCGLCGWWRRVHLGCRRVQIV